MYRAAYFYIGILLFGVACSSKTTIEENFENGKLKSRVLLKGSRFFYTEYYPNGTINNSGEVDKTGNKNGVWKYYHSDGRLKAEGHFKDDYKDGRWVYNFRNQNYRINWLTYLARPIKISIPDSWKVISDSLPNMPLFVISDSLGAAVNFNVFIHKNIKVSVINFIDEEIKKNASYGIVKVISRREVEIKREAAYEVIYDVNVNERMLIGLQYFIPRSNEIYMISFFVPKGKFDIYELLLGEIAYSFEIL
ncbi:hypothetical protein EGT74_14685 [Chitinophaga lutea]|uniref:MORN repeat variant n=1 Tax=Chitinophaga lutea TaxID=2488634 RepID=A0A3N4Q9A9_9BACT|nr:PsbP-related protein [Chitinophaga lutea]RPE08304.1 hypothetical protein EGT74_14685 [Chitinophaga lutea]